MYNGYAYKLMDTKSDFTLSSTYFVMRIFTIHNTMHFIVYIHTERNIYNYLPCSLKAILHFRQEVLSPYFSTKSMFTNYFVTRISYRRI